MSKEEFERLFEARAAPQSRVGASFLERATIATLAGTSLVSVVAVVLTLMQGDAAGRLTTLI